MKFILGRKIEMSQIFQEDGRVVPVTLIQAGPCTVTQVKEVGEEKSIQIGYDPGRKTNKAKEGHLKGLENFQVMKEFRVKDAEMNRGDQIDVSTFEIGDTVDVVGTSKGRGFQGVVKRHGFSGGPASHGHKDQLRMPGSIGSTGPQRVFKGMKMGGRMGGSRVTVKNLKVANIDKKNNVIALRGAVPGARNSLVMIQGE